MTFDEIKSLLAPRIEELCRELLPNGQPDGSGHWRIGSISGNRGDSLEIELQGPKAGLWLDRAGTDKGDSIDLIAQARGITKFQALQWAHEFLGIPVLAKASITPMPVDLLKFKHPKFKAIPAAAAWPYHDTQGRIIAYAVRFDFPPKPGETDPGKDVVPFRWIDGKWRSKGWLKDGLERSPLYNLHQLTSRPSFPVLLVEGEKTAEAALRIFPTRIVTTWQGGSKSFSKADLEPLQGRDVVFWPDADEPGLAVVDEVLAALPQARVVSLPPGLPDGWDLADSVPEDIDVIAIEAAARKAAPRPQKAPMLPAASMAATSSVTTESPLVEIAKELSGRRPDFAKIAGIVCEQLLDRGSFYRPISDPSFRSALFFDRRTKSLESILADSFKQTVSDRFGINRAATCWKHVWAAVENLSIGPNSKPAEPEAFWAGRPGAVYLSNGPGAIVRIQAEGVDLCDNGTDGVLFPRGQTLEPWTLTDPIDPFETCSLFRGVSTTAGHGPLLAKLWALSLPTSPQNKPPLVMAGPIGSGKTRFVLGLLQLYGLDPAGRVLAVDDDREADFWPVLDAGGVLIADNADTRVKWLPDALAQVATGLGRTQRKLFTDKELVAHRARSWVALTTARPEAFAGDPGLADRLLIVRMDRRRGETKDADLSREIADARNAGLSWVAQTIATALADDTEPPPGLNQRHPDFARFAFRLGRALGQEAEAVEALSAAEADKALFCLENDPVGTALLGFISDQVYFEGTARQLLEGLKERGQIDQDSRLSPKGVGRKIEGLWPHIEKVFEADRTLLRTGTKQYRIKQKQPCESLQPIEPTNDNQLF